jgi:YD repeat-containing protein
MTIPNQTSRISYTGDGSTTAFAVPFYFQANTDLVVYLQDTSGNQFLQVLGTNYNLSGATLSAGGTCTFVTAPTSGYLVAIYRDPPVTQTTSYNNNDPFAAKSHELALDKLTTLEQRTRDMVSRSLRQPDSDPSLDMHLPTQASRASKVLGFDSSGLPVATTGPSYVGGTEIGVAFVSTRAVAQVTVFDSAVAYVQTGGYTTAGDGGSARYKKGSGGGSFTDGNGISWVPVFTDNIYNVKVYGAKGDGSTDDTTTIQAAITAAAGKDVYLPAGTFVVTANVNYSTTGSFVSGLRLRGAGPELTYIDNRVASAACITSQSSSSGNFQLGGYIRDLTIKTTTSPVTSHGIDLKAVYNYRVSNVHVIGLSGDGMRITCALGDNDAANNVVFDGCRFETCNYGLNCNFSSGITQPSFIRVENCLFSQCTTAGYRFVGLQGTLINCGFVLCGVGLLMPYNNSNNAQFFAATNSFENNGTPQIQIDSLQGGEFYGTEIASTVTASTAGIYMAQSGSGTVQGCRIEGTRVRVGAGYNPHTMFTLGANATLNSIANTFWQTYDATGQTRYNSNASAYGNRVSDSFDAVQVGSAAGVSSLTLANGANNNVALPLDGVVYLITGPSGAFQINGFANGFDGRLLELHNNSGQTLTVNYEAAGSSAANRIRTDGGSNITVNNLGTITFRYIANFARWVVTGKG